MLSIFGGNSFFDLLGSPTFWLSVAIVAVLIVIIVMSFKHPKIGKPVILTLFSLAMVAVTAYCGIQVNYYYKADGGIHGKITGIFKTNEVEVVDNMSFEFKNIELTETSAGTYSAGMLVDKVISLDTKNSLGVFVNDMPCDITSEVHEDYAIAKYVYTFYDNYQTAILTDTLTLNFAFYENSTYLSLSTTGGAEAIKYWHYYFNKNGFIVEIAPFDYVDSTMQQGNGNISNYGVVKYYLDAELYQTKVYKTGETIELPKIGDSYYNWYIGNDLVDENYVVNGNVNLNAFTGDIIEAYDVNFVNGDNVTTYTLYSHETLEVPADPTREEYEFYGWSKDGHNVVEVQTTGYTEDVTYIALFGRIEEVYTYYSFVSGGTVNTDNLKDWFIDTKGYYDIDLTKSSIPVQLCHDSIGLVSGKNYIILTLDSTNIDSTIIIDSVSVPECVTSGSMTLTVLNDGTVTVNLNTFKIGTSSSNLSASEIKLTTQTTAQIYVITK